MSLSVSVSEDVVLVDAVTRMPVPAAESALMRLRGDGRFRRRPHPAQLELASRAALTVADAALQISAARTTLVDCLRGSVRIAAVGVHPSTALDTRGLRAGPEAPGPGAAGAGVPMSGGLRVQVAVGGAERALAVYNAARSYLPEIAALAANSPFLDGRDTGLSSARLKLAERAPHSGIPPAFSCWKVVEEFDDWATEAGLAPRHGNVAWDLRVSSRRGMLEFRIPDAQTQVRALAAVTAVCQALVAALIQRYDAGDALPVHESHAIARNRWRALRDGVDGVLLDLTAGTAVPTRARLAALLEMVEPHAESLGCRNEIAGAGLLAAENGAMRQRAVAAASGVPGLTGWLVEETEVGSAGEPASPWAH
jgi:carboxylate-amine ligase